MTLAVSSCHGADRGDSFNKLSQDRAAPGDPSLAAPSPGVECDYARLAADIHAYMDTEGASVREAMGKSLGSAYGAKGASGAGTDGGVTFETPVELLQRLASRLPFKPGERVVDLGSGIGVPLLYRQ